MKVDGTIDKFKARLVIQGFRQKERIDYFDTYAPVARITTIRLLLALAVIHNLMIHQMDVKTTFLNGDLDEEVYMKQPKGFVMSGTDQNQVDKTKKFLSSRFSMKDMGEADVILEKLKPNTKKPIDQLGYSRAIGCLVFIFYEWMGIPAWGRCHFMASKKQTCITGLTMETEFVALVTAAPISIQCDSAPRMARAYSQIYNGKSRQLGRHSMVRELIRNGVISIEFVQMQHNLADHVTKGLARDLGVQGAAPLAESRSRAPCWVPAARSAGEGRGGLPLVEVRGQRPDPNGISGTPILNVMALNFHAL
nr:zinc finger, CCHC-type [Tanacetum cinerariifolium]